MVKRKYIINLLISLLLLLTGSSSFALYGTNHNNSTKANLPTRIIIKFDKDISEKIRAGESKATPVTVGLAELDKISSKYQIKQIRPLIDKTNFSSGHNRFGGIYIFETSTDQNAEEILSEYKTVPGVLYAEIDQIAEYYDSPNDALYSHQWNLNNTGQEHYHVKRVYGTNNDELILTSGQNDADIDADEVFVNPPDKTSAVVVAIIDSGVDMDHPDLADNIWVNPNEIANDGLDNDFNGFIDDINGWNFGGNLINIGAGNNDPTDNHGHGTHLAGIVAAVTDNDIGIAGVAGNCKIMALNIDPIPFVSIIARAIIYAADNGADVINMSFGLYTQSDLVYDALAYADSKGVVLCAAAGNDGTEQYNYPAAYDLVIAIGATNDKDMVTSFSTYGRHINLCAPGQTILSLRADNTDMYASDREAGVHIIDDLYFLASGTSMSAPHVAGAAAYLRSVSPGLKPAKILEILQQTSDDLTDPFGVGWDLPGYDIYSGYGRLNLRAAIQSAPDKIAVIETPVQFGIISGTVEITGYADGSEFPGYIIEYGAGKEPTNWQRSVFASNPVTGGTLSSWNTDGLSGVYTIRLRVGFDNIAYRTVYIANENAVEILYPSFGETLTGITSVRARAYGPEFTSYRLEYRPVEETDGWELISSSSVPAFDNVVGEWSTGELTEGIYILRLTMVSKNNGEIFNEIEVQVQSLFSSVDAWKVPLDGVPSIIPNYGDFDGDGINEIVVGTSSGIYIYNTDGTTKTENMPEFPDNNFLIPIAVGDLDGDDIDDIVALGYDPPMVYSYRSSEPDFVNYLANFPGINFSSTEHAFTKLFLKDMDGDGRDEIFVHLYDRNTPLGFIIEADGSGLHKFEYLSEFLPADLDKNGLDEIYAFNSNFSSLRQLDINGNVINEIIMESEGESFTCSGLTAGDVDNDGVLELIVFGYYGHSNFVLHAFNYGFFSVPGWPHNLGIDPFVIPTVPVFGDLDNNGTLEYVTGFFDLDISYILAWNLDGTSYLPGSPNGHFAVTPQMGIANMLLLNDMNDDRMADIVAVANDDPFANYRVQRIYAWDSEASLLSDFPLVVAPGTSTGNRHTPTVGDINNDGYVDMVMTTADNNLVFINLPGNIYRECSAPVGHWRYNRRMNNIIPEPIPCDPTDITNNETIVPSGFGLSQNYPNPFNPSTTIQFSLETKSFTQLSIYNILGQNIKTIINEELPAGNHSIIWDGLDHKGNEVSSGIYFYRIETKSFSAARKMILLK